jgi:hypothetical protein
MYFNKYKDQKIYRLIYEKKENERTKKSFM